ncbi:class I SAM-dependent methyltransferase [uncultured Microbulbifer sp.]|uniref:class I SAM-dependent methyltransferase n=1 Tax=uncultured Microbulbifer sp. TaxID=348147 RepID=UPI002627A22A|nr:class I SAM-dependent methyltransferase [uncultured Microbulbifer sp.]
MCSGSCPLCRHPAAQFYHRDKFREYFQCAQCALVFVPPEFHLSVDAEKAYYELHENNLEDAGYRRFLGRCATPLLARLKPQSRGLDFGCGPAPLLAKMLEENGHQVATYDLFFQPDISALDDRFDFIVSTEVMEHLADPMAVLASLWRRLKAGGVLALMTKLVASPERFANWHYIRDPTHIVFFSIETFQWLAGQLSAQLEFSGSDVIFFTKRG